MEVRENQTIESIIDSSPVGRFQGVIIAFCALVAMIDGFDTQAIAFVAPEIAAAWHIAPSTFGPVFGVGLLGGLLGAMIFGFAGDRFGRKPTLALAMVLFAIGSLITPLVQTMPQLGVLRLLTGFGLGGAVPSFVALTSEYAPKRLRSSLVGLMFCGYPFGAMIGGIASAKLIPAFGWTSVFLVGGALPLLLLPLLVIFLPESVGFLALKNDHAAIERILKRVSGAMIWNGNLAVRVPQSRAPIAGLFRDGKATGTFLLWTTLFLSLLLSYFLVNWIPVIARQSGMSIQTSVIALSVANFGAVIGCLVVGRLADRFGPAMPISCAFALGALAIASIGHVGASAVLLYAVMFATGTLSIGAQMCTVALVASFYETFLRTTGVGWSIGVGRVGAILGPVLGGLLLAAGTPISTLFLLVGLASLGAGIAVFAMGRFALPRVRREALGTRLRTSP